MREGILHDGFPVFWQNTATSEHSMNPERGGHFYLLTAVSFLRSETRTSRHRRRRNDEPPVNRYSNLLSIG